MTKIDNKTLAQVLGGVKFNADACSLLDGWQRARQPACQTHERADQR